MESNPSNTLKRLSTFLGVPKQKLIKGILKGTKYLQRLQGVSSSQKTSFFCQVQYLII